jgi:uncharacterized protein YjbI with pentapeptide repeats
MIDSDAMKDPIYDTIRDLILDKNTTVQDLAAEDPLFLEFANAIEEAYVSFMNNKYESGESIHTAMRTGVNSTVEALSRYLEGIRQADYSYSTQEKLSAVIDYTLSKAGQYTKGMIARAYGGMLLQIHDNGVEKYFVKSLAYLETRHGPFHVHNLSNDNPFSVYTELLWQYLPTDTRETNTHYRSRLETLHILCEHTPEALSLQSPYRTSSLLNRLLLLASIRKQQNKMPEDLFKNPVTETNDLVWQSIVTFCERVKPLITSKICSTIKQNWLKPKKTRWATQDLKPAGTVLAFLINNGGRFAAGNWKPHLEGWNLSTTDFSNQKALPEVDTKTTVVHPKESLETTLKRFQNVPAGELGRMIDQLTPRIAGMEWQPPQTKILKQVLAQLHPKKSQCSYAPTEQPEQSVLILPAQQPIQYATAGELFEAYDAFGQIDFDALRRRAELAGAPIVEGRRPGGDFSQQNLAGAFLCSGLQKGNLTGVNAADAVFAYTDLREADLSEGDFSGAVFYGVDLRGANLRGANFENARFINCRMGPLHSKPMDMSWANFNIHYMHQSTWDGPIELRETTISGIFSHCKISKLDMRDATVNKVIFVATLADTLQFSETATDIEIAHSSRVHATHPNPNEIYVDETSYHQESLIYIPCSSNVSGLIIPDLLSQDSIGCPLGGELHNNPNVPWSTKSQDLQLASLLEAKQLGMSL